MLANFFIKKFHPIFKLTQEELADRLLKEMSKHKEYSINYQEGEFILCMNKNSNWAPCLVAHLDTVHPQKENYEMVPFNKNTEVWSPTGLGADDRAGVAAILTLLEKGHRPHILFTFDEEVGALGSYKMISKVPEQIMKPVSYFLQIDRRGHNDIVFYDNDNTNFHHDIILASENYFEKTIGSFSDISVLMSHYLIPGANVSAGYTNEHKLNETMNTVAFQSIVVAIEKILTNVEFNEANYEYLETTYSSSFGNYGSWNYNYTDYRDACQSCGMVGLVNEKGLCEWCDVYSESEPYLECLICGDTLSATNVSLGQSTCDQCRTWDTANHLKY